MRTVDGLVEASCVHRSVGTGLLILGLTLSRVDQAESHSPTREALCSFLGEKHASNSRIASHRLSSSPGTLLSWANLTQTSSTLVLHGLLRSLSSLALDRLFMENLGFEFKDAKVDRKGLGFSEWIAEREKQFVTPGASSRYAPSKSFLKQRDEVDAGLLRTRPCSFCPGRRSKLERKYARYATRYPMQDMWIEANQLYRCGFSSRNAILVIMAIWLLSSVETIVYVVGGKNLTSPGGLFLLFALLLQLILGVLAFVIWSPRRSFSSCMKPTVILLSTILPQLLFGAVFLLSINSNGSSHPAEDLHAMVTKLWRFYLPVICTSIYRGTAFPLPPLLTLCASAIDTSWASFVVIYPHPLSPELILPVISFGAFVPFITYYISSKNDFNVRYVFILHRAMTKGRRLVGVDKSESTVSILLASSNTPGGGSSGGSNWNLADVSRTVNVSVVAVLPQSSVCSCCSS